MARGTTPSRLTKGIRRFLRLLDAGGTPIWLPFAFTSTDYKVRYCLSNCEAESRRTGSQMVFGWMIWEARAQDFIEAEFHSVIRRGGYLWDVTPRLDGEKLVLFVPDLKRTAERVDERTWRTWTNFKQAGSQIEAPRRINLQDDNPNVLA